MSAPDHEALQQQRVVVDASRSATALWICGSWSAHGLARAGGDVAGERCGAEGRSVVGDQPQWGDFSGRRSYQAIQQGVTEQSFNLGVASSTSAMASEVVVVVATCQPNSYLA
jgi:hypothetical protein